MVMTSKEICNSCTHKKKDCPNKYVHEGDVVIACKWYEKIEPEG